MADSDSHPMRNDPAAALRVIGQDIPDLLPLTLEIEVDRDTFVISGRGLPEPLQEEGPAQRMVRQIWHALVRRDPSADLVDWQLKAVPFSRTYSLDDLGQSDRRHAAKRTAAGGLPEIYSLGERLRIVGRLVQAKGGELVRLSKTLTSVSFEYRGPDNALHREEHSAEEIYRMQRQFYAQRGAGALGSA